MSETIREYKCPACGAPLIWDGSANKMKCGHCGNTFEIGVLQSFKAAQDSTFARETEDWQEFRPTDVIEGMALYECPSCGGEIACHETTVATQCPYCGNPTIIRKQVSGVFRPEAVIPFKKTKEDAVQALHRFYRGKPLLPKTFTSDNMIEKVQGMYVPFWLYDCGTSAHMTYEGLKVHNWVSGDYSYTRTDHYLVVRDGNIFFKMIPADGSKAMDDAYMDSIEPYAYEELQNFDEAYLSGFLANRYDVTPDEVLPRINQRVRESCKRVMESSIVGYSEVIPTGSSISINRTQIHYVFMPVWVLTTRYNGRPYTFMMNGQSGEIIGKLPSSTARAITIFVSIVLVCLLIAVIIVFAVMGRVLL